jgi:hypothetical protein
VNVCDISPAGAKYCWTTLCVLYIWVNFLKVCDY